MVDVCDSWALVIKQSTAVRGASSHATGTGAYVEKPAPRPTAAME